MPAAVKPTRGGGGEGAKIGCRHGVRLRGHIAGVGYGWWYAGVQWWGRTRCS